MCLKILDISVVVYRKNDLSEENKVIVHLCFVTDATEAQHGMRILRNATRHL